MSNTARVIGIKDTCADARALPLPPHRSCKSICLRPIKTRRPKMQQAKFDYKLVMFCIRTSKLQARMFCDPPPAKGGMSQKHHSSLALSQQEGLYTFWGPIAFEHGSNHMSFLNLLPPLREELWELMDTRSFFRGCSRFPLRPPLVPSIRPCKVSRKKEPRHTRPRHIAASCSMKSKCLPNGAASSQEA